MDVFKPTNAAELAAHIAQAYADRQALELLGSSSKVSLGRAVEAHHQLDLSGFDQIESYEPTELVLVSGPGLKLEALSEQLQGAQQHLPFELFDYGPLLGELAGAGTLGGMISAGFAGSRRVASGGIRDYMLGFQGVSGKGEIYKAGGRVVKNVTGYDLPRLMAGAFGTLSCLTEVAMKVGPAPETSQTLIIADLDETEGIKRLCAALGSAQEVSGAAFLPPGTVRTPGLTQIGLGSDRSLTLFRLEGFSLSVEARLASLKADILESEDEAFTEDESASTALWQWLNQAGPLLGPRFADQYVWRLSVPPADGARVGYALRELGAELYFDWSGGLIHAAASPECTPEAVRGTLSATGGHATLIRAPAEVRQSISPFQPLLPAEEAMSQRVKAAFDPAGILNPNRMYEGF